MSMGANYPPGRGPYGPQGHSKQDLKRGPLNIATQNMKALGFVVLEKKILLCFSHDAPPGRGLYALNGHG